jgi:hypothetical protein
VGSNIDWENIKNDPELTAKIVAIIEQRELEQKLMESYADRFTNNPNFGKPNPIKINRNQKMIYKAILEASEKLSDALSKFTEVEENGTVNYTIDQEYINIALISINAIAKGLEFLSEYGENSKGDVTIPLSERLNDIIKKHKESFKQ